MLFYCAINIGSIDIGHMHIYIVHVYVRMDICHGAASYIYIYAHAYICICIHISSCMHMPAQGRTGATPNVRSIININQQYVQSSQVYTKIGRLALFIEVHVHACIKPHTLRLDCGLMFVQASNKPTANIAPRLI